MASERVPDEHAPLGWDADADPAVSEIMRMLLQADPNTLREVRDILTELLAARHAQADLSIDRYDGDGYSVRRLSPEESRRLGLDRLGLDRLERSGGTIYYSDEEFQAALDAIPSPDAHV